MDAGKMTIVKTSSKFQIAIPKQIRKKLGIQAGQNMIMSDEDGKIMLTPIPENPVDFLCGILKDEPSMTDELLLERKQDNLNE